MIGVPGTAHRLFGALREEGISVILISQGSSEHSICCAIPQDQAERAAARACAQAFERELKEGQIQSVDVDPDLAILAVVGDGMAGTPGVAGKVFNALGTANVNVRAIAQGASERNISVVVDGKHATRALRAVHAGFYLSPHTLSIGVIGPGYRGQCAARSARLAERAAARAVQDRPARARHPRLEAHAAAGSRASISPTGARSIEQQVRSRRISSASSSTCMSTTCRTRCCIDCTASSRDRAVTIASGSRPASTSSRPTRKPTARDLAFYRAVREARRDESARTICTKRRSAPGCRSIQTLRDLRETGDEIVEHRGHFLRHPRLSVQRL